MSLGMPFVRHLAIDVKNVAIQNEMAVNWVIDDMQNHLVCHAGPQTLSAGHHMSIDLSHYAIGSNPAIALINHDIPESESISRNISSNFVVVFQLRMVMDL